MTTTSAIGRTPKSPAQGRRRPPTAASKVEPLFVTEGFLRDYDRASGPMAYAAEQEVQTLIRRMRDQPQTWIRQYDRVEGLKGGTVIELELGGAARLLVHVGAEVTLWRMGDHEITTRARRSPLPTPGEGHPAPAQFLLDASSRLFPADRGGDLVRYLNEVSPDWIHTLDAQQATHAARIKSAIEDALCAGESSTHLILGGPGTGKTTMLVWLLKHLATVSPDGRETWDVRFSLPDAVATYLQNATGWDLSEARRKVTDDDSGEVVLVDDPMSLAEIDQLVRPRSNGRPLVVVAAFDPLQLATSLSDADLADACQRWATEPVWLDACYRQKEAVGAVAVEVVNSVARSTPFLAEQKKAAYWEERRHLTERANGIRFVNPSGRVRTCADTTFEEWHSHIQWLWALRRRGDMWNHWPSVLLVQDPSADLPETWAELLNPLTTHRITTDKLDRAKGVEYQHVILVLGRRMYRALDQGFEGTGRNGYNQFRLMRIPFTRGKDSLATFVIDDAD